MALLSRYRQFSAHGDYTAAQYLFEQKKNEEAIALYTKAIEIDPKFARAYFDRGNVYAEVGDNAKALADCKKVTELDATLIYGHFNLACFYSLQGMLPESLAAMETAMQAGYRKFDKIDTDSDLENVRRKPEFAKLVEKYKAQTPKLTAPQVFQTSSAAQRAAMLADAASLSKAEALRVAELGFSDPRRPGAGAERGLLCDARFAAIGVFPLDGTLRQRWLCQEGRCEPADCARKAGRGPRAADLRFGQRPGEVLFHPDPGRVSARRDRLPGSSPFWTMRIPLRAVLPRRPLPNSMRSRPFLRSPRPWNAWRRPRTRMRKWRKFGWKWQKGTWKSKPRRKAATEGESGTGPVLGP